MIFPDVIQAAETVQVLGELEINDFKSQVEAIYFFNRKMQVLLEEGALIL